MRLRERALERALADWLLRRENEPALEPGEFARQLASEIRTSFLSELRELAKIEGLELGSEAFELPGLPGFRLVRRLGHGGTGEVHEAEELASGARVAIKFLHRHVASDPRARARFRREVEAARTLVHPRIVRVLAAGEHAGIPYLVMELLAGRTLQSLLQAWRDTADPEHAFAVRFFSDRAGLRRHFAAVAEALHFAHRRGVVHRDLKPGNLMVADDGALTVLDFGLAATSSPQSVVLTRTGDFLGTPLYMAPEQARAEGAATPRTDLWSLGAVLYECLAGRSAIEPGPLPRVLARLLEGAILPLATCCQGLEPALARLVTSCLSCDPEQRPVSARAFAQALLLPEAPVAASTETSRTRPCSARTHPALRFARRVLVGFADRAPRAV